MKRTGSGGYWVCCMSCALLWIYWGLFIFRMCDNDVSNFKANVDFKGATDIKAKFLKKNRKGTDVDAGMIDESQEQRETVISSGSAYDNNDDPFAEPNNNNDNESRKNTISAYDDDGIRGHGPSAGSWQDVEED